VAPGVGPVALAYVHKSAWDPGTQVTVDGRAAVVEELPFSVG
jgi:hypothetical protein